MSTHSGFHIVTVGWSRELIAELGADIAGQSHARFSHIAHPRHLASDWPGNKAPDGVRFFRGTRQATLPPADPLFLESLERQCVPTIHNMILGDQVVCRLDYSVAQRYATFLAARLMKLYDDMRPSVVIGGFDSLHGGLAFAVARHMGIPWFALHFSVIPSGLACFCDRMSPAARVTLAPTPRAELLELAESSLRRFEKRSIQAYAYVPPPRSLRHAVAKFPSHVASAARTLHKGRDRDFARFTEVEPRYDLTAALRQLWRSQRAHSAATSADALSAPPAGPYVLFGLHMQPESSIDVWAPFFSNQMWVIELLSRSIPPSHKLLVKIHKSDASRYSRAMLDRMRSFPGIELIRPTSDSRAFIEKANLVIAIQGTVGLEAALLGRPVIMLGDSPVTTFPSVARVAALDELPELVRRQLQAPRPGHQEIVEAYANYLGPFLPASHNDWRTRKGATEVQGFVKMFEALRVYLNGGHDATAGLSK